MEQEIPLLSKSQVHLIKLMHDKEGLREDHLPVFRLHENSDGYVLSFAQERLWFLHTSSGENPFYNEPILLELTGELVLPALHFALNKIRQRHSALRTHFRANDGVPEQYIYEADTFPIEKWDLSGADQHTADLKLSEVCENASTQSLDLQTDDLCKVTILKYTEQKHLAVFFMHHIVCDGWSMAVLVNELITYYSMYCGESSNNTTIIEPSDLPIQYRDYALWEKQVLRGSYLNSLADFWKKNLAGAPKRISLPRDRDIVTKPSYKGDRIPIHLSPDLTEKVLRLNQAQGHDVTLFSCLLAVFFVALNYIGNDDDLVVGTDVANRANSEAEKLIGFFVNQLVLRCQIDDRVTFNQLVSQVGIVCNQAFKHQMYPFDRLVESLALERVAGVSPVFQVKFVLQNTPLPPLKLEDLTLTQKSFSRGSAKFDLLLDLTLRNGQLEGWLEYAKDYFDDLTAQRIYQVYENLLGIVTDEPNLQLMKIKQRLKDVERDYRKKIRSQRLPQVDSFAFSQSKIGSE